MDLFNWFIALIVGAVVLIISTGITISVTAQLSTGQWQVKAVANGHAQYVPDGDRLEWRWIDHTGCEE